MRNHKFAIPNTEANKELIEFLHRSQYDLHGPGPGMSDKPDTYFTFTINRSGYVGNKRNVPLAKLYDRNEYDEHVPLAVINAQP